MFFNIPGKEITPVELSKEITVAILQQQTKFTAREIVDIVYPEVLPQEFREKGYIEIPGNDMFVVYPNRNHLEKLVSESVSRMLDSGDVINLGGNPCSYFVKR